MSLRIENLTFRYRTPGAAPRPALQDVSLSVEDGEMLALMGPSGSGKTTLMQHITGLLKPDAGRVLVDGLDVWHPKTDLARLRRTVGLVFQFPESQLFEHTVFDDIAFAARNQGLAENEVERRVRDALDRVGLDFETFQGRAPFTLSVGEKRRVALAGILAMQPRCLILDEPTAGLDRNGVEAVIDILRSFHARGGTVILISHNPDLVAELVDRVVVLNQGRIVFDGDTRRLFSRPAWLRENGLALPRLMPVVTRLKEQGLLNNNPNTLAELKRELRKQLEKQPTVES